LSVGQIKAMVWQRPDANLQVADYDTKCHKNEYRIKKNISWV